MFPLPVGVRFFLTAGPGNFGYTSAGRSLLRGNARWYTGFSAFGVARFGLQVVNQPST